MHYACIRHLSSVPCGLTLRFSGGAAPSAATCLSIGGGSRLWPNFPEAS